MKPKIVVVVGPTASGKSDCAVCVAKEFDGEVVSADSRQVYKGLDIGTGKITPEEMQGIPHHLLDVADPQTQCTVSDYKKLADHAINDIIQRGKLPILCGGTGFYIQAVVDNITLPEVSPNTELRKQLKEKPAVELFALLKEKDPEYAEVIDKYNSHRLIRALEIVETLGSVPPIQSAPQYHSLQIGISTDNDTLRKKIKERLLKRIDQGMIEEVKQLHGEGMSWERMEEFGLEYRYIARYLQGKLSHEEMVEKLYNEIWHYAKRQKTWFKKDARIQWFSVTDTESIFKEVELFVKKPDHD
jgi:tRNA dimethylallyltransferase